MGRLHFLKEKNFYVNLLIILLLCVAPPKSSQKEDLTRDKVFIHPEAKTSLRG